MTPEEILLDNYSNTKKKCESEIDQLNKKSDRFSHIRLTVFLTGIILSIVNFYIFNPLIALYTFLFSISVLAVIVHFHNRLIFEIKKLNHRVRITDEQTARITLDWKNIPPPVFNFDAAELSLQKDLDIFGEYSLHHLIDISFSEEGSKNLGLALSITKPNLEDIANRRKIISEIRSFPEFIEKFILKYRLISRRTIDNDRNILNWFYKMTDIKISTLTIIISAALIVIYAGLFILNVTIFPNTFWIIPFIIYLIYYFSRQNKFKEVMEEAETIENQMIRYEKMFAFIQEETPNVAANFRTRFKNIFSSGSPSDDLKLLRRYMMMIIYFSNPILKLIVNLLFPYDLVVMKKLVSVRNEIGKNIESWLNEIHEIECLISLSNFAYLNPAYAFPELKDDPEFKKIKCIEIGHPLLPYKKRIENDFSLIKENEITIITGSNMSGKSTFLKTIGINLILAYSGAPVCAKEFAVFPFRIFSCIKVSDSVTDGISYFYAEVKRLKELLELIETEGSENILFLIDEIFKGTNNRERLTGSRSFIKKLSEMKTMGFISTHDLELVHLEDEIDSISNYHFKEEIENGKMIFDYKIQKGPCPTTNALRIMQIEGLPVSEN
jgi:ABC-type multidrug transport system fused ATPase/permease subunit